MKSNIKAINCTLRDARPNKPGEFQYIENPKGEICGMALFCPCGCGPAGYLGFDNSDARAQDPTWTWNGNLNEPTLTPSIHRTTSCGWHGFLTDGIFKQC